MTFLNVVILRDLYFIDGNKVFLISTYQKKKKIYVFKDCALVTLVLAVFWK